MGHHPSHHVPAEDVDDHVEIIVRPLYRPLEFRDVPRPELIGRTGKQLGLLVMGMRKLISPFPHFLMFPQNPVYGTHGAQVIAFIQKSAIYLPGRLIDKAICMENIQDSLFFIAGQGQG